MNQLLQSSLTMTIFVLSKSLFAQPVETPKTEYGHPDLQGTFTFRTITPLQRPAELADKATFTAEEAADWADYENRRQNRDLIIDSVGGAGYPPGVISYNEFWYERGNDTVSDRRTSLVYDPPNGRLPPLNASGRERNSVVRRMRRDSAGPEARTLNDRCIINNRTGPPLISGSYNNNMQLVQTRGHVMIMTEMVHHARIIPFAEDFETPLPQWAGRSIARWEDDTLVVISKHFYPEYGWRNTSPSLRIEERFTWVDHNTLDYDFTIEDPAMWDQPWSARLPMRRIEEPIFEYACHEGNHGLMGILAGWRRWEVEGKNQGRIPSVDDDE